MKKGFFVTFEGNEGAGKSTLIQAIAKLCEKKGIPVAVTREPGGERLAEGIRELLLNESMHPRTELLLYEAARAEHVERVIRPNLLKNKLVLCDRYSDSSLAYQAMGRGLKWNWVRTLNNFATDKVRPHLTVFLKIPVEKGLKVATQSNRFEKEGMAFHLKVRKGFEKVIREEKKRFLVIEGHSASPEVMASWVLETILKKRKK